MPAGSSAPLDDDELTLDSAFARLWRGFMAARIAIAMVLVILLGALRTLAPSLNLSQWLVVLCATYLTAALAVRMFSRPLPPGHTFDPQWVSTIGVDLIAFAVLQFVQAAGINYSPLFALPVLMAAVLGSSLLALGTAAGVTILLLTDAWVISLHGTTEVTAPFLQAALTGTGYFALAFLVNQLAGRLAREELAARQGRLAARMQAQVNALVIEALSEGVLVVDGHWRVHAANPAARALLRQADAPAAQFSLESDPAWKPLLTLAAHTFERRAQQLGELSLDADAGSARRIHARTRLTSSDGKHGESLCVIFLQDLREMEARLRTEKLAAMGRMSAAVAHEIRNPLAAIAQANDLMEEDLHEPALRQLSGLIRKNAQRLAQTVDEILDISRAHPSASARPALALDASVAAACRDWSVQTRNDARLRFEAGAPGVVARFDPDHLRRVLVNLLDNAARYAGTEADSIRVVTSVASATASLVVWSDGARLEASVEEHLFEPFFSSESRSSGLGLFICRELCERHGAVIGYARCRGGTAGHPRDGNEFVVTFAFGKLPSAQSPSFDTISV